MRDDSDKPVGRILNLRFGYGPIVSPPTEAEAVIREWLEAMRITASLKAERDEVHERWYQAYRRLQFAEYAVSAAIPAGVRYQVDGLVVRRGFIPNEDTIVIEPPTRGATGGG